MTEIPLLIIIGFSMLIEWHVTIIVVQLTLTQYQSANQPRHIVEEDDPESKEIRHELLALINLLACVGKNEAYILVDLDTSDVEPDRRRSVQMDSDENVFADPSSPLTPHSKNSRSLSFSSNSGSSHGGPQKNMQRRVVVTLDHLRREYQAELDRVSRIEQGDWEFGAVGTEDVDMDNDLTMVFP
jgi:nuclear pore complex protein Nup160